ncbi:MAG: hypothetical protein Q9222_000089 [Ikaeria aurantiellina]
MQVEPRGTSLADDAMILQASLWLRAFPEMRKLQIELCFARNAYRVPKKQNYRDEKQQLDFVKWVEKRCSESMAKVESKPPRLQQLVITGLPYLEMSVGLVKAWARYVVPEGVVGIACGSTCRQEECARLGVGLTPRSLKHRLKPNIVYRKQCELDGWILYKNHGFTMQITHFTA